MSERHSDHHTVDTAVVLSRGYNELRQLSQLLLRPWPFLFALLLASVPVLAICWLATPRFSVVDDLVQALFPEGGYYGQTQYLMVYSLAPISVPLGVLGKLFPGLPVFALCQLLFLVLSTAVMFWITSRKVPNALLRFVFLGILLACESFLTTYLTYTSVAFVACAAGLTLLLVNSVNVNMPRFLGQDIAGCLLIFFAISLRPESGFASFVLFLPLMIWVFVRNRHLSSVVRLLAAVAFAVLAYVSGMVAYLLTPGWQQLPRALKVGRAVLDTQPLDHATIQAVAPQLSDNDIEMLYDWYIAEKNVFSLDVFQAVSRVTHKYSLDNIATNGARHLLLSVVAVFVLILLTTVLARTISQPRDPIIVLYAGIILCFIGLLAVLALRGRMPSRVLFPMGVVGIFAIFTCSFCFMDSSNETDLHRDVRVRPHRWLVIVLVLSLAVSLVTTVFIPVHHLRQIRGSVSNSAVLPRRIQEYATAHSDQIFIISLNDYDSAAVKAYTIFELPKHFRYPDNLIPRSDWRNYTGINENILKKKNFDSNCPYVSLVTVSGTFLISNQARALRMLVFLQQHVDPGITVQKLDTLGPNGVDDAVSVYEFSRYR